MEVPRLSRVQSVVGLLAGLSSLCGAVYSGMRYLTVPEPGQIAAFVREARTERPVPDATIEVLTPDWALVTTLVPAADGWTHHPIREGAYRVRVTHARLATETREIDVRSGAAAEVRFDLVPRTAIAAAPSGRKRRSGGPVSRFLTRFGL